MTLDTVDARSIALGNIVFRTKMGSELFGTSTGNGDRDEWGICIEPPECRLGLCEFERYEYRDQPDGVRSGPGDLDLVIYSLRKWTSLAAEGNPNVLPMIFAPESMWTLTPIQQLNCRWFGRELQASKDLFITKDAGRRFLGYLYRQKMQMVGGLSKKTNRPELVDVYGFDTKFAYHAIRVGLQGIELMRKGTISLPISEPHRSILIELRQGAYSKQYALSWIDYLQNELAEATRLADIPDSADMIKVNQWLVRSYTNWWEGM